MDVVVNLYSINQVIPTPVTLVDKTFTQTLCHSLLGCRLSENAEPSVHPKAQNCIVLGTLGVSCAT